MICMHAAQQDVVEDESGMVSMIRLSIVQMRNAGQSFLHKPDLAHCCLDCSSPQI